MESYDQGDMLSSEQMAITKVWESFLTETLTSIKSTSFT